MFIMEILEDVNKQKEGVKITHNPAALLDDSCQRFDLGLGLGLGLGLQLHALCAYTHVYTYILYFNI